MNGKANVRFSELFADTLAAHGYDFAHNYYVTKNGMSEWEFSFWFNAGWITE